MLYTKKNNVTSTCLIKFYLSIYASTCICLKNPIELSLFKILILRTTLRQSLKVLFFLELYPNFKCVMAHII